MFNLARGQSVTYHSGNLSYDKCSDNALKAIAKLAWTGYEAGKLILIQRVTKRHGRDSQRVDCDYIAVGR